MERFCFYLPEFSNKSNGIAVVWETAYEFYQLGYEVKIVTFSGYSFETVVPEKFSPLLGKVYEGNEIVVYPDVITANPLGADRVARFLLAKPFVLEGKRIEFGENDFIFSYSKAVLDDPPYLTLLNPELLLLKDRYLQKKESQVVLYFGKVRFGDLNLKALKPLIQSFSRCRIVTRKTPHSPEQLYTEIARSELFISFDPLTNLCLEATLLETPTLIADPVFKPHFDSFNYKNFGFFYDVNDFELAKNEVKKANPEIQRHWALKTTLTQSLINELLEHFRNPSPERNRTLINEIEKVSRRFYETSWNRFPIFNCLNYRFLLIYLIFSEHLKAYLVFRIFYRVIMRPFRTLKKEFNWVFKSKTSGKMRESASNEFPITWQERFCYNLIMRKAGVS